MTAISLFVLAPAASRHNARESGAAVAIALSNRRFASEIWILVDKVCEKNKARAKQRHDGNAACACSGDTDASTCPFGGFGGDGNPFGVNFNFGDFPERSVAAIRAGNARYDPARRLMVDKSWLLINMPLPLFDMIVSSIIARLHIEYPMLFKVINEGANRHSHCGVLEFSAPEGSCFMPYWMMQNLFVKEGGIINIQNISLPKATFVKIRPQSQDFLDITNPRAVLEASLRKFSCLTIGDTICLKYNNKNFLLDVREVRPAPAACIIETDCEVDFEAPADYVPPPPAPVKPAAAAPVNSDAPYGGVSTVSSADVGKLTRGKSGLGGGGLRLNKKSGGQSSTDAAALRAARLRKYESFHGTGQSLNGATTTAPTLGGNRLGGGSSSFSSASVSRTASGERVRVAADEEEKEEKAPAPAPKAPVPFQGEGRRLR
ncbi:Ubiquitin fusion degradation protein, partial [Globisporangium splendens]